MLNFASVVFKMDMYFQLRILIPSLFQSSLVGRINEFLDELYFILNEVYYENFLSHVTELISTRSKEICGCKS